MSRILSVALVAFLTAVTVYFWITDISLGTSAKCPDSFAEFLARFQDDRDFQIRHIQIPLENMWQVRVDGTGDWETKSEWLSAQEVGRRQLAYGIGTDIIRENALETRIESWGDEDGWKVTWYAPDSDAFAQDRYFARRDQCWGLAKMENSALVE